MIDFSSALELSESSKEQGHILRRDASASVLDFDVELTLLPLYVVDLDRDEALIRELNGVSNQVHQDLLDTPRVSHQPRHLERAALSVLLNFHILLNFIRYTGPMVSRGQQFTGGLALLPLVEMNWGKKSKKKPNVLTNFHHLVYFIRH